MGIGFSGRGFKFAIGVGRLLADLARQEPGYYDSEFWLDRYSLQNPARHASDPKSGFLSTRQHGSRAIQNRVFHAAYTWHLRFPLLR
jgi:hypothetical protein